MAINYDRQEEFLEELIDSLRSMKASARSEELFEDIDDIITEVKETMNQLKKEITLTEKLNEL